MRRRTFIRQTSVATSAVLIAGLMDVKGVDNASASPTTPPNCKRAVHTQCAFQNVDFGGGIIRRRSVCLCDDGTCKLICDPINNNCYIGYESRAGWVTDRSCSAAPAWECSCWGLTGGGDPCSEFKCPLGNWAN